MAPNHPGGELAPVPPDGRRARGLTAAQVAERTARGEVNDVPLRSSRSTADIVRANVLTRFNAIIGVLWLVMLVVAPVQDSLFGYVILANTGIGILQELRAKKTLDSLAVVGEARPTVRRDGATERISTAGLVLGDVIEIGPGEKIAVDGRCLEADGLEVDESLLTGEPEPAVKQPGDELLSGSFVVAGTGAFTATKVGREAYAARLTEEASRFTLVHSELRSGVSVILKYVAWMMVPTALALAVSQLVAYGRDFKGSVARAVGGIVPMVPEGLVLLTSVAFAIGVIRLGRHRCLVQELPAIEGLARVDTVCLDKTGTLTEGGVSVTELRTLDGSDEREVRAVLAALGGTDPRPNASLRAIIEAFPEARPGGRPPAGPAAPVLPFSSARGYSAATLDGGEAPRTWLLGAPDVLLPAAHPQLAAAARLDEQGLRVLLLARAARGRGAHDPDVAAGARPAALVVLEQRLRPDAPDVLRYFVAERVGTKVLSGDNAVSVGAVAARLGLPGAEDPLDARTLPDDPDGMAEAVERGTVFGRVAPRQKQAMVGALQSRGHVVAMTGDGVNDVLALKDADIGVSMGSGSEATRAVAQVVLLDDSFAALPAVVAEGRRVIGNITRVATLFLLKTVYSVLLAVLVVLFRVEYPFLPRHLTLLATLTIGVPAFLLALAPNTERARPHFVRQVMRYALPGGVLMGAATFATYMLARGHYTGPGALTAETSAATLTLFLVSLWVLAIVARPYTWWRICLVPAMGLCFLLVLTVPELQRFFALKLIGMAVPWAAVAVAVVASAGLELVWRRAGRRATV
ncbi:magnesium-transporting ATPase [Streptomyces sulfonofaciens]|uniref:Magnesium-transporting ATPase n=1 Tax=Streptomyces sulfonofaciens TaxID=68272 RepID=A0A919FMT6_9ACTN|nr:HAD-IC family P-type ATPase [Streptomyces sulfonofaciens]GHH69066.1 magnesium-transporting ATPase [Streptomyces sulfonofaciens]